MKQLLVMLVAVLALTACDGPQIPMATSTDDAAGKQFQPPPPGKAALYIVAGKVAVLSPITVGQIQAGTLKGNTWLRVDIPAGRYDLRFQGLDNVATLQLDAIAGELYFVRLNWSGRLPIYHRFEVMEPDAGRAAVLQGQRAASVQSP